MKKLSERDSKKAKEFLEAFSKQSQAVRDAVAAQIPEYNELLNMRARSFPEIALRDEAKRQGKFRDIGLIDYDEIRPKCPRCKNTSNITRKTLDGEQYYHCRSCGLNCKANWQSISSDTNKSSVVWMKILRCMLDFYTVERTHIVTDCAPQTIYNIRNRLIYGMELMLKDMRCYDKVQCDITFIRANYRGTNLNDDTPEDSIFDVVDYVPRKRKNRGGPQGLDPFSLVSVFTAVDSSGHVMTRFIGLGPATAKGIANAVDNKILLAVPDEDPCPVTNPKRIGDEKPSPGTTSLLISDKENAIKLFAKNYGILHEAHVYRKNGIQLKLPAGANDIQKVNALHQRLKKFIRKVNCSTEYLPSYLTLFEWIENTGATQQAIDRLFSILASPGLGRPAGFYKDRYIIPNHLMRILYEKGPAALSSLTKQQLYAYYFYKQRRLLIEAGRKDEALSTSKIAEMTGFTEDRVRRNFKNLYSSGYDELIMNFVNSLENNKQKNFDSVCFSKERLALYDEYAQLIKNQDLSLNRFVQMVNKRDGTTYSYKLILDSFNKIAEEGIRPSYKVKLFSSFALANEHHTKLYQEYLTALEESKNLSSKASDPDIIAAEIGARNGYTLEEIKRVFDRAKSTLNAKQNNT